MPKFIVLTGGPGGGKSTLIEELKQSPIWRDAFLTLPEAIFTTGQVGISSREPQFQKLVVETQCALEQAVQRTLESDDLRCILCHRGSLDPLAYWMDRGWNEADFFHYTGTTLEQQYQRYTAVIHLVTAADGAADHYRRWPDSHRRETMAQAIALDHLLQHVWSAHPHYHRIDNAGRDWLAKSTAARDILRKYCRIG